MIRHVVCFKFNPGAPESARAAMAEGLQSLPGRVSVIRQWSQGANTQSSDRSYDFSLIADFDSLGDLGVYQDHPAHQEVVTTLIRPIVNSVVVVDFEVPSGS
ncbi:MAG TPA: Dabb family protein [Armatimonadota bacterium]|nr:Dabb family protein [Armatimonadota bacterium]